METRTDVEDGTDLSNATDADAAAEPTTISKDDAFHLLQNSRRRAVLRYVLDHPGTQKFRMRDVAEEVAAWEHDTTVRQLDSDERQRVYIALYQSHLPKLDEHDLIDYNQSRGIIEPKALVTALAPYLGDGLHADEELVAAGESTVGAETQRGSDAGDSKRIENVVHSLLNG